MVLFNLLVLFFLCFSGLLSVAKRGEVASVSRMGLGGGVVVERKGEEAEDTGEWSMGGWRGGEDGGRVSFQRVCERAWLGG